MSNDNIFREVDEELRSDRMRRFWRQFGPYVIGAAIAIVLLVAINEGWAWWQNSQAAASSDRLYAALELADGGDVEAAKTALEEVAASGSGGYPTLARFREAGLIAANGDADAAIVAYDALATSESNPRLRELALVMAGNLLVDAGTLAEVESRVAAIAVEGNPLRNAAREVLGLAQVKAGEMTGAQATFEAILNDPLTQNSQRQRAGFYLAQLLAQGDIAPEAEAAGEADVAAEAEEPAPQAPEENEAPAAE